MQWFRFYTEAVGDKKLRRIARDTNECMAHVLGVWTIVLSMASDSPVRGTLLISDDVPATIEDINDAAGCNVTATFQKLLVTGLVTANVTEDGQTVYAVPAWDSRQFESDSSATRVRRHRERKKAAQNDANVTPEKRYGNAPDTDTDTDTETEDISELPFTDPPTPKATKPRRESASSQQDMFGAIAETCELDPRLKRGMIAKTAKSLLDAGYTPEHIRGFKEWWLADSWRAEHTPVPSIAKLTDKLQQFRNIVGQGAPVASTNGKVAGFSLDDILGGVNERNCAAS